VRSKRRTGMELLEAQQGKLLNLRVGHISLNHREEWRQEPATEEGMVLLVGEVQVRIMAKEVVISPCLVLAGMDKVEACLAKGHQAMVRVLTVRHRVKDNMTRTICHRCLSQCLNHMEHRTLP